jgi:hypothetical protein
MDDEPDQISVPRHRDLAGRRMEVWLRRGALLVLLGICAAGLANVFGQRARTSVAAGPAATLRVEAPDRLRGGLLGQVLIRVAARERIGEPRLVLGPGWTDQVTVNTISPEAEAQADSGGRLVLAYGPIAAGGTLTVRIEFQVNPVNIGRRSQDVELRDGATTVVRVTRMLTVFP